MRNRITIENLHLLTGLILILSGILSYREDGITSTLSWAIFGAMYISMSDIGESKMDDSEKAAINYKIRTFTAYLGVSLSTWFLFITL